MTANKLTKGLWIISLFICFLCLMEIRTAVAEEGGDLELVLSKLKDRFSSSKTFQADYVRELVPKVASKLPSSSFQAEGVLYFRSPHKLRLDQKKPRPEQLICNGNKVWWYLTEEKVVNVYRLKDYYSQIKPIIDFLSGLGRLDKDFSIHLDKNLPEEAPFYQLVLKPKVPQPDLEHILVRVSKTTFLPVEFSFDNLMGDETRFRFNRMKTGVSLADSWFEFTPPKGTQVISQPPLNPPRK
jgi:outer membrane lipoprotein carrier protein